MVESKEEPNGFLMRVKDESEKAGLKFREVRSWHLVPLGKVGTVTYFIFLNSRSTVDGDFSHENKRCLLFGRKAMANLDSMLQNKDITLLTKIHIAKAVVFPVVMYGCESWTLKKAECQRIDAFELWC